ncbi:MAG: fibronectin type III domain-containing protein [Bacillota bacterium]
MFKPPLGKGKKTLLVLGLLVLLLALVPALPAMAAAGDSEATLGTPPEGEAVAEVTSVAGTAYDPDGVMGVSIAIQNASGQYLQHLTNGGWAPTFKAFSATLTGPDPDGIYIWEVGPITAQIFTDGTYTVTILVNDGTNIDLHYKSFSVDATGPVLSNPVPEPDSFIAGSSQERFAITATDTPAGVSTVQLVYKIGAAGTEVTVSLALTGGNVYEATADLSATSVGDVVYYRFEATDTVGNTSTSPETDWYLVTVDKQAPGEVTDLTVTVPPEGGKLVLTWTDPEDEDYALANVYCKDVSEEEWILAGSAAKGEQTFTITGLDPSGDTKYAVKVTTVDNFGNESDGITDDNNGEGYAAKDVKPPAEVSDLQVSIVPAGGALDLEWTNPADDDYAGANVYFKKLTDTSWTHSGTVTGDVYQYRIEDLANGVPYAVKVTTFDLYNNESAGVVDDNNGQGYVPTDTQAPSEVTNAQATAPASGGVIVLTWTDPAGIDLNHVNVYIREKGSDARGDAISVPKGIGSYEFSNLDRTGETLYEFKISVVDATYNESEGVVLDNNGQGYAAKDTLPPSEPTSLVVTIPAQGNSLKVQWSDPSDADLDHINVYCRPVGTTGDAWGAPQQVAKGVGSCLITGLANGHAYEVKLTAVDDIGNESTGVVLDNNGQGYLPTQTPVDTTPPGEVENLVVAYAPGAGSFKLSFTAPEDEDLDGVQVFVAVYGTEDWTEVAFADCGPGEDVALVVNLAGGFVLGKDSVQFKVVAVDTSGNESQDVVAHNGGQGYLVVACYELTPGPDGWRTFSVPVRLAGSQALLGDVISLDAVEIAWKFEAAGQRWVQVTEENNTIQPLEAVYVKLSGPALAVITPSSVATSPPVKELAAGWNLVGFTQADLVSDALYSVCGKWNAAVSPAVNPAAWAVTPASTPAPNVLPHQGYWVYMDVPDTLAGFSTTPVTVGTYPGCGD